MMRFVHAVLVGTIAVGVTGWPASVAYSTGQMTQKQAALKGLTVTRKTPDATVDKLIVKLRTGKTQVQTTTMTTARAQSLAKAAGTGMQSLRTMAGGAHLMQLDHPMTVSEARVVAARLAQDPDVEYAEPNVRFRKFAAPNEPRFAQWQWNLFAPTSTYTGTISGAQTLSTTAVGGANLPPAWDMTTGSSAVTVAVIDSGIVNHNDLNGVANSATYVPSGRFLPGYDFISQTVTGAPANFVANDGNGRDPDPSDPGDWITVADKTNYADCRDPGEVAPPYTAVDSSWHGTHMAGVVAATANNAAGIAGIGWNIFVVPIRALGKCGGDLSDIAEALRWAAALQVTGVPANPNKAQVISLSLGGGDTCGPTMQAAVDAAIGAGAVVVAATGNAGELGLIAPANCDGVIAVTAHTINGENADYANIASTMVPKAEMLSAPGGGPPTQLGAGGPTDNSNWDGYYIYSSVLFGPTSPTSSSAGGSVGPAYAGFTGTSPATPHVAGVAALIKSFAPEATPAEIQSFLISSTSVRPYPAGSVCATGGVFAGQCGTGLLDAEKALSAVGPLALPASVAGNDQVVAPGTTVTLNGAASKAYFGKTITSYAWTQTGGTPSVTLATPAAMTTTFTAPATGALTFRLRVTDSAVKVGEDLMVVRVNSAPTLAAAPAGPTVAIGSVVSLTVTATDVDGDPLTYVATTGSTVPLTALSPAGQFDWNTTGYNAGTYQLTYFATDGLAQSTIQTVTITLTAGSAAVPPASSGGGGGGGALPWLQLLLLGALLVAPRIRQRVG